MDSKQFLVRLKVLGLLLGLVFGIFIIRLIDLQIFGYEAFALEAKSQHEKRSVLPARRGKILVRKNRVSDDVTPLATNNTLKMLFVDPLILAYPEYNPKLPLSEQEPGNPQLVAQLLAPILIHAHCEVVEGCEINLDEASWTPTETQAISIYQQELYAIFAQIERVRVLLESEVSTNRVAEIEALKLPGISVDGTQVLANPTQIFDTTSTAQTLSPILNIEVDILERLLERRPRRYTEVMHKMVPEVSAAVIELKKNPRYASLLRGIQLRDEHWRYYPERVLAAQVLGFVDSREIGQYGIEGRFDYELRGKEGSIYGATNTRGQRILGKDSSITRAKDGADILISIDRVIQGQVERILAEDTERFQADFGQVIVVEPETGRILAMANAPTFDPNEFGKAFLKYEIDPEQVQADLEDETFNQRIITEFIEGRYYRYFNNWGPQVFRNKIVSDVYEPGSVMKAITLAAALNADEITPETTFDDKAPIEVDEFKIRNADEIYDGETTMIEVMNRSLNTGIAFIAQKMGAELLYEYFQNFGFAQYTDIELDGEADGSLSFWKDWTDSELVTRGFGQGVSVTPLQMAMAFASLANGGYLMKPLLVEEIRYKDGRETRVFQPEIVRRVISDKSYNQIKSMLFRSVNEGVARGGRVYGYSVMGKTGTSQTYKNGKALEGLGTTITSFAGFGPIKEPKFVVLVKYDYPKTSQWGSETAAATFQEIADFLFDYFEVPPDR